MKCFDCNTNLIETKSNFGYYYKCPKCKKTFETNGQKNFNSHKFKERSDYTKQNEENKA